MKILIENHLQTETGCYAQKELTYFLERYSPAEICTCGKAELALILEVSSDLSPESWKIQGTGGRILLSGGSESSLLCCVYELLEKMGLRFSTEGEFLAHPLRIHAADDLSLEVHPRCASRGIRQHINFPMDISSYPLEEAREYIRNLARMKFNAITFHGYNAQWHPICNADGEYREGGHFFYGQRHYVPEEPRLAACIRNRREFCIPECEPILEDSKKREEFASWWLRQVMRTAKQAGMTVTYSMEPKGEAKTCFRDLEASKDAIRTIFEQYPEIDTLEMITAEGGGNVQSLTRENAAEFAASLFGTEILENGRLPFCEEPPGALGGTLTSLKTAVDLLDSLKEAYPDKQLRVGLYVTCAKTLKITKAIMDKVVPPDCQLSFLPAHGAEAVAETVDFMAFTPEERRRTMLYSWIEFDGNMYLQQNCCGGIHRLMEIAAGNSPDTPVSGICLNHWRTAENSLVLSYAARELIAPLAPADYYRQYACEHAIGRPETFAAAMSRLEALNGFNRDNLFNVGFCYLGCWLNPKGLGWIANWTPESIRYSIGEYGAAAEELARCLEDSSQAEGISRVRFLINRCQCSMLHLRCIDQLEIVQTLTRDHDAGIDDPRQREQASAACDAALSYAKEYMDTHILCMPDRGCEGTLTSYWATIPVYIHHALHCCVLGEPNCRHRPETLDAPPSPDRKYLR